MFENYNVCNTLYHVQKWYKYFKILIIKMNRLNIFLTKICCNFKLSKIILNKNPKNELNQHSGMASETID